MLGPKCFLRFRAEETGAQKGQEMNSAGSHT